MTILAVLCVILMVSSLALGIALYVALHRNAVVPSGQPTAEEANIANVFELQKKKLQESTSSTADARRMSDEEIESAVNRRHPE